jgi:DNA-nicking Smr family endonuclease
MKGREAPLKGGDLHPAAIDAALHRRITRGRDAIAARIDLHGMTQDLARAALTAFFRRAVEEGWRAILVITGKGVGGDGVLRRRVPDWLAEPPLRDQIAGVSEAHRRHGGEGALYVALKRKR